MLSFFLDDANFWFSCAIGVVVALFILEIAGMLFGVSLLGLIDDQAALDADTDTASGFTEFGSWLALDRVPLLVWLVLLLTSFGIAGLLLNFFSQALINNYFTLWLVMPVALLFGLLFTARFGSFIARLLPKQESSATTADELVGCVGHITVGVARQDSPAEGKFVDTHGQPHYLLVEPLEPEEQFSQGERILLIQKQDYRWLASRYSDL